MLCTRTFTRAPGFDSVQIVAQRFPQKGGNRLVESPAIFYAADP